MGGEAAGRGATGAAPAPLPLVTLLVGAARPAVDTEAGARDTDTPPPDGSMNAGFPLTPSAAARARTVAGRSAASLATAAWMASATWGGVAGARVVSGTRSRTSVVVMSVEPSGLV
jgi:hypothetical protein